MLMKSQLHCNKKMIYPSGRESHTCTCTKFLTMFENQQEHPHSASQEGKSQSQTLRTKYWEYTPFQCQTPDTKHEKAYLFELFHFCKWLRAASERVLLPILRMCSREGSRFQIPESRIQIQDSRIQNPESRNRFQQIVLPDLYTCKNFAVQSDCSI